MNKTFVVVVLLLTSIAGCVTLPQDHRPQTAPGSALKQEPLATGPVTADQVEPANAHRMAEAIWDEMDRDQQQDQPPASAKDAKKR